MDYNDPRRRRNTSDDPQTPTQDEAPPSYQDSINPASPSSSGHRIRALTDISQSFIPRRPPWSPAGGGPSYSPLNNHPDPDPEPDHDTPIRRAPPTNRSNARGIGIHLNIPQANTVHTTHGGSSPSSPMDGAGFQAAMAGIPGLDFYPMMGSVSDDRSSRRRNHSSNNSMQLPQHLRAGSIPSIVTIPDDHQEQEAHMADISLSDTMPLTPNAATFAGSNSIDSAMDSSSSRRPRPSRMLGDDLPTRHTQLSVSADSSGSQRSPSNRSLSPASPLTRSRTLLRAMSQRIVNMSNEQNVVDSIRARESEYRPQEQIELSEIPPIPNFTDGPDSYDEPHHPRDDDSMAPLSKERTPDWRLNPFKGNSLGLFSPENKFRMFLCDVLIHPLTEHFIFLLIVIQTILLAVDSCRPVTYNKPTQFRFHTPIDYCLVVLFGIYTFEVLAKIIVSGFLINALEYSTVNRSMGLGKAISAKMHDLLGNPHVIRQSNLQTQSTLHQPSLLKSLTMRNQPDGVELQGDSTLSKRARLAHRAYLRHSFNRLDFLAVCSYWISFIMQLFYVEADRHMAIFRMLSCLRIMRLLWLTNGTTVILRSLKKAAPLLLRVGFLIGFFWLLFAIIGVQSFKSSLARQCTWLDPNDSTNNFTQYLVFCGGQLDAVTYNPTPWMFVNSSGLLEFGATTSKGYLCPVQSICLQQTNPYNGSVSFDNIFNSLELVFVVMTSNTFTDIMYYTTNTDYLAAALFFVFGTTILFFWMVNLLIAVITSSFQVIREESKTSAFTGENEEVMRAEAEEGLASPKKVKRNRLKTAFDKTEYFWVIVIAFGLLVQCTRSASMSTSRTFWINTAETAVTLTLLLEIVLRFLVDYRNFFKSKRNWADLIIAVITTVMQIPAIHNSGEAYNWLTFFQIVRIYRVVLAVPITRELIMTMLGNFSGLLNLILFVLMMTFLAGILATQMFRGTLPRQDSQGNTIRTEFTSLWNSMLGMYQILSSENWTNIMYYVTNYDISYNTGWVGAAFFIIWFIVGNFIILNMFIAVIQENFDISEDEKRLQQVKAFLEQREPVTAAHGNLALSNIFRYGMVSGRRLEPNVYGSQATEMLLRDAVVRDFLDTNDDPSGLASPTYDQPPRPGSGRPMSLRPAPSAMVRNGTISSIWTTFVGKISNQEPNPFYSHIIFNQAASGDEIDPRAMARHVLQEQNSRKVAQREYLRRHPMYNVSLFLFSNKNPIRQFCQKVVGPGRGERIEGLHPSVPLWYAFSSIIYVAIVAMVILACITTPLYQKEYFQSHNESPSPYNWFTWTDLGFAAIFTAEAIIKVIADGFFWTPNAYYRSTWGFIDGIVLVTLWINVSSSLYNAADVARAVGAFKALRALRLLNISDSARENFHSVIIRMGVKVISAALVSLSLLIPFAVYGLNLFSNRMNICNDNNSGISNLNNCIGEYPDNTPFNWDVLSPRVVANPYFNFDNFGSALFILFQIVSQEGWIDVMWSAQSITGIFTQPEAFVSQQYAIFFVAFNLLGAVFVLTLFVSVFMRNYTEMTGVAFLTAEQRSWLELKKLLEQINPSKRLKKGKETPLTQRLYKLAKAKTGLWQRFVTVILVFHLLLLCANFSPSPTWWDDTSGKFIYDFCILV
jgi:hypothetical protein